MRTTNTSKWYNQNSAALIWKIWTFVLAILTLKTSETVQHWRPLERLPMTQDFWRTFSIAKNTSSHVSLIDAIFYAFHYLSQAAIRRYSLQRNIEKLVRFLYAKTFPSFRATEKRRLATHMSVDQLASSTSGPFLLRVFTFQYDLEKESLFLLYCPSCPCRHGPSSQF